MTEFVKAGINNFLLLIDFKVQLFFGFIELVGAQLFVFIHSHESFAIHLFLQLYEIWDTMQWFMLSRLIFNAHDGINI